jgi:hypothetical protein
VQTAAPLPGPAEVERALRRVYARPEFAPERTDGWLYRFNQWWQGVEDAFWGFIDRLHLLQHTAPVLFWILIAWLVLALIAILAHLGMTAAAAIRARDAADRRQAAEGGGPLRPRTAQDWDEEARRAAEAGRLREASVYTYQAMLLRLDARGVVRFDPCKTPGDYRRETRRHAGPGNAFGQFLRIFEPVVFGGRAMDGEGYQRLRAAAAEAVGHG